MYSIEALFGLRNGQHQMGYVMGSSKRSLAVVVFFLGFGISGCSSVNFKHLSTQGPDFDFIGYFDGHTRASGWFADRFGNVKRHFCGDFFGELQGDVFNLDEKLYYSDGVVEERVWSVVISPEGEFSAESDSLVGPATGELSGSGLRMDYVMNVLIAEDKIWKLAMKDYMFLQPDRSLHNSTEVNKWGIRIGNVSTQYYKHDGSETCAAMEKLASTPVRKLSVAS